MIHRILLLVSLAFAAQFAWSQSADLRLPISLDADSTDYDGKSSMLMFRGLRLTQGSIGVVADEGRASKLDFEDSVWHFSGNVVIDTDNGRIESESADLRFAGHQLRHATITGAPATFEMRRPGSDEITYAQANNLSYDFGQGVVEFTGQAQITEGGNQIASTYLVYNIREQRIQASSGGNGEPKVRITYTPGTDAAPEDAAAEDDAEPDEDIPEGPGESGT